MERIALFGGVFDPIHNGHVAAAKLVAEKLHPQELILIPSGNPPHKRTRRVSNAEDRFQMTALAAKKYGFSVSRYEIDKQGFSYTVDTLLHFRQAYGQDTELLFLIGSDNIEQVKTWYQHEEIPRLATIVVVARPGYDISLAKRVFPDCYCLTGEGIDLSSTAVRDAAREGEDFSPLVCDEVCQYIMEHRLYGRTVDAQAFVKSRIGEKRMRHTLGVCDTAKRLAAQYGADIDKAYLAALLHDCAKEMPLEELLKFCKECDIIPDHIQAGQTALLHAVVGEEMAYRKLGIDDNEILHAIRYHTTGCADMPLLTKIIYLADCIEPGREYEGIDRVRKTAEKKGLEEACLLSLEENILFLIRSGKLIHPDTLMARNDLLEKGRRIDDERKAGTDRENAGCEEGQGH